MISSSSGTCGPSSRSMPSRTWSISPRTWPRIWAGNSTTNTVPGFSNRHAPRSTDGKPRSHRSKQPVAHGSHGSHSCSSGVQTPIVPGGQLPRDVTWHTSLRGLGSSMWVTDLRHYLDDDSNLVELPEPVLTLAVYFGSIAAWASRLPSRDFQLTNVPCRRRPGRKRCWGEILAQGLPGNRGDRLDVPAL